MKKLLAVVFSLFLCSSAFSQFEIGVKAGLSSQQLSDEKILIPGNDKSLEISVRDAQYGFHFGLYSRISLFNFYVEPAFLLNSSSVSYNLQEQIFDSGVINSVRSETYNNLDIPVLVGTRFSIFRVHAGPVAHVLLTSTSELTAIEGYSQRLKEASYGFQAGVGVDIWKMRFDVNYEGNLSRFGDNVTIGGNQLSLTDAPSRIVASVGIRF